MNLRSCIINLGDGCFINGYVLKSIRVSSLSFENSSSIFTAFNFRSFNRTLQPSSQSFLIDINEALLRPGNIIALWAREERSVESASSP